MASSRLARRFQPYAKQAQEQTAIRYGAQESGLQSIFNQRTRDYTRDANAQQTAYRSLLGSLQAAPADLNRVYNDVGLNPGLLQSLAGTPTGARLAGQLARSQAGIQQQTLGAQTGNQYQRQHLAEQYGDDVSQIQQQGQALQREKGLYQSSLLDQLISDDRARRSAINAAARKQAHDDAAAAQQQQAARDNALIGQGLLPDEKGVLQPLPGGKADPNAPGNQPKPKAPKRASTKDQSRLTTDYSRALGIAQGLAEGEQLTPALRKKIEGWILNGADAVESRPVYDTRQKLPDETINPNYGKPLLNRDGTPRMTDDAVEGIPQIDNGPAVQAALDMVFNGSITPETLQALHDLGYKVRGLKGVKTPGDVRKARQTGTPPITSAPRMPNGRPLPT